MTIVSRTVCVALLLAACGGGSGSSTGPGSETSGGEQAASAVPAGYHSITPHLVVADADAALSFYQRALGATQTERFAAPNGTVVHAEMRIGDSIVMLGPEEAERGQRAPGSAGGTSGAIWVYVEDVDAAAARAIAAGATQLVPPTDMFWGDRFASLRDPMGHRWQLATHRVELTMEQIGERAQAFFAAMQAGQPPPPGFQPGDPPARSYRPEGYFDVTPVLIVESPGAIDVYVRALGATERNRALMPDGRLLHGEVQIGDSIVMLSGEMPEDPSEADAKTPAHLGAATLTLLHYTSDADAAHGRALAAGASSAMPPADMFWGDRYGVVVDPSGHPWALATHQRDVSDEEMQAALAQMGHSQH